MTTTHKPLKIRHWPRGDRPSEKLYRLKAHDLSHAELLALLIGTGNAQSSALDLARAVLASCDNQLRKLTKRSIAQLMRIKGIGRTKATALVAFAELSRRREKEEAIEKPFIRGTMEAVRYIMPQVADLDHEVFGALFLNIAGRIIASEYIFEGGLTTTVVDMRILLKKAIEYCSSSIIVYHNHPSGRPEPSKADIELTQKIKAGARLLDIDLNDHIIIAGKEYFSFAEEGYL
jgi:DNA repair protein RadC